MEEKASLIGSLLEKAETYSKTSLDLLKLKAIDRSADAVSALVSRIILVFTASIIALFANIGLALWIGELMGKSYYGFFSVALFYVLVAVVLYLFRDELIKRPVENSVILHLTKEKNAA